MWRLETPSCACLTSLPAFRWCSMTAAAERQKQILGRGNGGPPKGGTPNPKLSRRDYSLGSLGFGVPPLGGPPSLSPVSEPPGMFNGAGLCGRRCDIVQASAPSKRQSL